MKLVKSDISKIDNKINNNNNQIDWNVEAKREKVFEAHNERIYTYGIYQSFKKEKLYSTSHSTIQFAKLIKDTTPLIHKVLWCLLIINGSIYNL